MPAQELPAIGVRNIGEVRILTLQHPERLNALDVNDRTKLLAALREARAEPRAVVLTGAGRIFCAGGELRSMVIEPAAARARLELLNDVIRELALGPMPVVCAIEGGAFGIGLSLACASDIIIASRDSRYSASFVKIGLISDAGLSWTLPRRIGSSRARVLMLTARTVEAEEAERIGLVDELVEPGAALSRAIEVAAGLANLTANVSGSVRQLMGRTPGTLDEALEEETNLQIARLADPLFSDRRARFLAR